uniref:NADH-ubiquinone oxidoreductase chain 4 n=1 Tax=Ameiurus melas TaxID=219545 RepID=A0A0S3H7I0_AMEME|nr:NADH dehydrogenase subunit 4 [Ameiurus melas]
MLKIVIRSILLYQQLWLSPSIWVSTSTTLQSFSIAYVSVIWINWASETGWASSNLYMGTDPLSTPLLVLTCWLLPLMILASQNHIKAEPIARQRNYITLLASLQPFLFMPFGPSEIIMFYNMFVATLIPTLIIITPWANEAVRQRAGTYFLLYTLAGSLPLLVALLVLHLNTGSLSMLIIQYSEPIALSSWGDKIWWAACLIPLLVKMPLYRLLLWLPNADVEGPLGASMLLATFFLNLGAYGMMRLMLMLHPLSKDMLFPVMALPVTRVLMTGSICLRQTDLKTFIPYTSGTRMALLPGGIWIQCRYGITGGLVWIIADGLVWSALFCSANTTYKRTHSRTMILARGMQIIFPLTAVWWFLSNLANLALPPLPNLMGELVIITPLLNCSPWTLFLTGPATQITAPYWLYFFLTAQRGPLPQHIINLQPFHTREHELLTRLPLAVLLLITNPQFMWGWWY